MAASAQNIRSYVHSYCRVSYTVCMCMSISMINYFNILHWGLRMAPVLKFCNKVAACIRTYVLKY